MASKIVSGIEILKKTEIWILSCSKIVVIILINIGFDHQRLLHSILGRKQP